MLVFCASAVFAFAPANKLYEDFIEEVSTYGVKTGTGQFGAMMDIELINDGPVTFMLEVKNG